MFFKIKKSNPDTIIQKTEREIKLKKDVLDSILSFCQMKHPNEAILILRGKSKKGNVLIDGLVIPPFAFNAHASSGFPHYMLPADISYVGTVHSHPSGNPSPSITDLNNFYELISLIVGFPYGDKDIFAWDSNGNAVKLTII
ncbi:Putative metal-dependent protease of the PAD1/JAB1 superfamily [Candidatus Nitrosarchaeum limnium SFB1]|jgi:proteasome lid subunit RPN8/RPN11|uniref:Putative metal-dependent protease of the PAD1/JAB1 superfamily n=1 Tax=Candidatus Nitrosarchaeum limnium SFB1 TaxID=886738 RepID=F3KJE5_9ARCH|nr:Putative metal-dependent protease of the PAD1/JAB1 superfamily [Candidatus Nitrosarchaeum limnium SFB1]